MQELSESTLQLNFAVYLVIVYVAIIAFADCSSRPFGVAYPLIALQTLGYGEIVITIILFIQTLCSIRKDLKYQNLNSISLRLKHVVLVFLLVIKVEQEVIESLIGYRNELINLIYLHAIPVLLGACAWIVLARRKNSFS